MADNTKKKKQKKRAFRKLVRRNGELIVVFVDENGKEIPNGQLKNYDLEGSDTSNSSGEEPNTGGGSDDDDDKPNDRPRGGSKVPYNEGSAFATRPNTGSGKSLFEMFNFSNFDGQGPEVDALKYGSSPPSTQRLGDGLSGAAGGISGPTGPMKGAYSQAIVDGSVDTNVVNPQLIGLIQEAALRSPYQVVITSGERKGDSRFHGKNMAVDVKLIDPTTGQELDNYQSAQTFRAYEQFAQTVKNVQLATDPSMDRSLRWGGYFSGPIGKYGAVDLMHFDLGGNQVGMQGGSWENGLTPTQKKLLPGAVSVGMGDLSQWKQLPPPGTSPIRELQEAQAAQQPELPYDGPESMAPGANNADFDLGTGPDFGELQSALQGLKEQAGDTTPLTPPPSPLDQQTQDALNTVNVRPDGTEVPVDQAGASDIGGNKPPSLGPSVVSPWMGSDNSVYPSMIDDPKYAPSGEDLSKRLMTEEDVRNGPGTPLGTGPLANGPSSMLQGNVAGPASNYAPSLTNSALGAIDTAAPMITQDPDSFIKKAYLDQLIKAEGNAAIDQLFGYGKVQNLSEAHPNTRVYYNKGSDWSTSAGPFQINYGTWQEFSKGAPFNTMEGQYATAWNIAENNYALTTNGRDLLGDLKSGNDDAILSGYINNANRWASLPGGKQPRVSPNELLEGFKNDLASNKPYEPPVPRTRPASMDNNTPASEGMPNMGGFAGGAAPNVGAVVNSGSVGRGGSNTPGAENGMNTASTAGGAGSSPPTWNPTPRAPLTPSQTSTGNASIVPNSNVAGKAGGFMGGNTSSSGGVGGASGVGGGVTKPLTREEINKFTSM